MRIRSSLQFGLIPGRSYSSGFVPTIYIWSSQQIILLLSFLVNAVDGLLVLHSQFFVFRGEFEEIQKLCYGPYLPQIFFL